MPRISRTETPTVVGLGVPCMGPPKKRRSTVGPSPPTSVKAFRSPPARPHPYALLLGNTVAVDVDSFPHFRDEQMVSVSYIYITWTKSTSWAREAWPVQWDGFSLVLVNVTWLNTRWVRSRSLHEVRVDSEEKRRGGRCWHV